MTSRIPAPIEPLLASYLQLMSSRLPDLLEGFYLHGSLSLDAFNPRLSDIDFVAVTTRPCTTDDQAVLRDIHGEIARRYPRWPLEGGYVRRADLARCAEQVDPHPHYHDGVLSPGHRDLGWVTRWLLRQRGIAVLGPPPDQLAICVEWADLSAAMELNLRDYWGRFTSDPRRIAWLLSDYGVQWSVLGVLRQLYSFRERDIISKSGAGLYALEQLPPRWHRIVREALRIRDGGDARPYRSRLTRAVEAHAFMRYLIALCQEQPAE